ncbi:MAG: hypothetical protein ACKVKV_07270, partial [Dehalococcoidia bacterium]
YVDAGDDELVMDWLVSEYVELENALRQAESAMATVSPEELDEAESEKSELEQSLSDAFEKKDIRLGKKFNQQLVRNTSLLKDLYEQWTAKG